MFDFKSSISIKTIEKTIQIDNNEEMIKLLSEEDLFTYKDKYNFIHISLTQVALKPLTLQGLNESLVTSLRDVRRLDWEQSLVRVQSLGWVGLDSTE